MRRSASLLITDLDDTLWDWVKIWHTCFSAMLERLVANSRVPQDTLLRDFKSVFSRHGTTEYAFALEELDSLREKHPGEDLTVVYADAIEAYREARRRVITLYPTVSDTLEKIKDQGVLLVAYTESKGFYTRYRLRKLGLDRVFDYLYSPEDDDLPAHMSPEQVRHYEEEHYQLRRTVHRHTPRGAHKPSPDVLLQMIRDLGATPEDALYVGDKLFKDVSMAQAAGVVDVWAKYGEAHERQEYELLRQVTHWSNEAVQKERDATEAQVQPSYVLERTFSELLDHFKFERFSPPSDASLNRVVDVWKKVVEVQQHFNDIELRIRNYALTAFVGITGLAGLTLKEKLSLTLLGQEVTVGSILLFVGGWGLLAFLFMDRYWYHPLLYGAVQQGREIEDRYRRHVPGMTLTTKIAATSPLRVWRWELHSKHKYWFFYPVLIIVLWAAALVTCKCGVDGQNTPETPSTTSAPATVFEVEGEAL